MAKKRKRRRKQTIFEIIESKNITMTDIARSTGVSLSYVSLVFHGKREPRVTMAIKMAQYVGVSIEDFVALCG